MVVRVWVCLSPFLSAGLAGVGAVGFLSSFEKNWGIFRESFVL